MGDIKFLTKMNARVASIDTIVVAAELYFFCGPLRDCLRRGPFFSNCSTVLLLFNACFSCPVLPRSLF